MKHLQTYRETTVGTEQAVLTEQGAAKFLHSISRLLGRSQTTRYQFFRRYTCQKPQIIAFSIQSKTEPMGRDRRTIAVGSSEKYFSNTIVKTINQVGNCLLCHPTITNLVRICGRHQEEQERNILRKSTWRNRPPWITLCMQKLTFADEAPPLK